MDKKKKITVLVLCVLLCLAAAGGTFAWYVYGGADAKRGQTDEAQVMAPYNLYLLNPNAKDTLQFAVGSLHPGETKQVVVCVSNKRPDNYAGEDSGAGSDIAKDSEFGYDLMLVHTENLAVDYKIYPLKPSSSADADVITIDDDNARYYWKQSQSSLKGSNISADMKKRVFGNTSTDNVVNAGAYWVSKDENMKLVYKNGTYQHNYYLIEITWQNISNFDDYKKETDLVYVVVNAKQPRPVVNTAAP